MYLYKSGLWRLCYKYLLLIFIMLHALRAGVNFEKYFINRTMRVDFYHIGDINTDKITLDHVYKEGVWSGSLHNLIDPFNNGKYYINYHA